MKRRILPTVLILCLALGSTSCFSSSIDKIQAALNDSITQLDQQSAAWQSTLGALEQKLENLSKDLTEQVKSLLVASIQAAGVESRCSIDFIGLRVKNVLRNMLNALQHKPPLSPDPHVCNTNPLGDLELTKVESGLTHELDIDGYDLNVKGGFSLAVQNHLGQLTPIESVRYVSNPSLYVVNLNLSRGNGYQIPADTQKLIFLYNGQAIGDMNVEGIPPPPPPPPQISVRNLVVTFSTHDDDKDDNSILTVQIESFGGQRVAFWAQQGNLLFDNGSTHTVTLSPQVVRREDLRAARLDICIAPDGNDTWRFSYVLSGMVSDGSSYTIAENSLQLTQDNRCRFKAIN